MGEISVTVKPDATDFRRVLWWYQGRRKAVIVLIVTILLLILGVAVSGKMDGPKLVGIRLEFVLVSLIMPFIFLGNSFWSIRKQARKLEEISYPTTLTFDADGIRSVSDSSHTFVEWSRYDKVVETSDDFVIFPQENLFYSVPKRFLEEASTVSLRTLLRENLGDRAKVM